MPNNKEFQRAPEDWIEKSLASIGVATIVSDAQGRVLYMNSVAESLTEWPLRDAMGQPVITVFRIVNETTREPVPHPVEEVLNTGEPLTFSAHLMLIGRDGSEWLLYEGAAPVRDKSQLLIGAILIFRDISEQRHKDREIEYARAFAEGIISTIRETIVVLDALMNVRVANRSFYQSFQVSPSETVGHSFYELGNHQWDTPELRELLGEVITKDTPFDNLEVKHDFEGIGSRVMVLNARRLEIVGRKTGLILLAIEDVTDRRKSIESLTISESRYRRLFETAQDGILLVDPISRQVFDANPFLTDLLGFTHEDLVGKELWEIGLFQDIDSNRLAFQTLLDDGYIRYEDLPLLTKDGRHIDVEFVSNVYPVGQTKVIQCNIRDITDRKRAEDAINLAHAELENRVRERTAELGHTNGTLKNEIARRELAESDRRTLQGRLATAQEEERQRIARELHDEMGQTLTALSLGIKLVVDSTPENIPLKAKLENLQALTVQMGREVHHLALELRPTALDDLGLHAAIVNYIESWSERTGIKVDFQSTGIADIRIRSVIETVLYRVIQESLTNILKHASARNVSVVLVRVQHQISAVIEDDGKGFDSDNLFMDLSPTRRLGLLGMHERVALINGTLTIESKPGKGTTIIVRAPLSPEDSNG